MASILRIETYNDNSNTRIETEFIGLLSDPISKSITVQALDHVIITREVEGEMVEEDIPSRDVINMVADNSFRIPVVNVIGETVYINPGDSILRMKTVGEFAMWYVLLFKRHDLPLEQVVQGAILKKKGLSSTPLLFPEALLSYINTDIDPLYE